MSEKLDGTPLFDGPTRGPDQYIQFNHMRQTRSTFVAQVVLITLITVILFSLFVAVFYFTFAAQVETQVVSGSIKGFVASLAEDLKVLLPPKQSDAIGRMLSTAKLPDMAAADEEVRQANKSLLKSTCIVLAIVTAVLIVAIFGTWGGLKIHAVKKLGAGVAVKGVNYPDLAHLFRISAITFLGVVAAEFVFLYVIAKQFRPLDPNVVKKRMIEALIANIQKMEANQ